MEQHKLFWLRDEISIAEELLSLAPKLTEEFLAYHTDFLEGNFEKGVPYKNPKYDTNTIQSRRDAWLVDPLKYQWASKNVLVDFYSRPGVEDRFPTATALTKKYKDVCPISTYSIIDKNNVITRHIGGENMDGDTIRIHIPLIVPPGDIFLEVEGVEIDWSDLFGFANQYVHSAHNYSDYRRLVYLIDIKRSFLGIEPAAPYEPGRAENFPDFVRGERPKQLHKNQKA